MRKIRFTLLSDGSSDRALMPMLSWLLQSFGEDLLPQGEWADLSVLRGGAANLSDRIHWAIELFPCELLFIHRDAERQDPEARYVEVEAAFLKIQQSTAQPAKICVVPVRMQEAWLLFDERAIRVAAGNPGGQQPLGLPKIEELETLVDPKALLHEALALASGLVGRRLKKFEPRRHCFAVAEFAAETGYEPLKRLSAFQRLRCDVERFLGGGGFL